MLFSAGCSYKAYPGTLLAEICGENVCEISVRAVLERLSGLRGGESYKTAYFCGVSGKIP